MKLSKTFHFFIVIYFNISFGFFSFEGESGKLIFNSSSGEKVVDKSFIRNFLKANRDNEKHLLDFLDNKGINCLRANSYSLNLQKLELCSILNNFYTADDLILKATENHCPDIASEESSSLSLVVKPYRRYLPKGDRCESENDPKVEATKCSWVTFEGGFKLPEDRTSMAHIEGSWVNRMKKQFSPDYSQIDKPYDILFEEEKYDEIIAKAERDGQFPYEKQYCKLVQLADRLPNIKLENIIRKGLGMNYLAPKEINGVQSSCMKFPEIKHQKGYRELTVPDFDSVNNCYHDLVKKILASESNESPYPKFESEKNKPKGPVTDGFEFKKLILDTQAACRNYLKKESMSLGDRLHYEYEVKKRKSLEKDLHDAKSRYEYSLKWISNFREAFFKKENIEKYLTCSDLKKQMGESSKQEERDVYNHKCSGVIKEFEEWWAYLKREEGRASKYQEEYLAHKKSLLDFEQKYHDLYDNKDYRSRVMNILKDFPKEYSSEFDAVFLELSKSTDFNKISVSSLINSTMSYEKNYLKPLFAEINKQKENLDLSVEKIIGKKIPLRELPTITLGRGSKKPEGIFDIFTKPFEDGLEFLGDIATGFMGAITKPIKEAFDKFDAEARRVGSRLGREWNRVDWSESFDNVINELILNPIEFVFCGGKKPKDPDDEDKNNDNCVEAGINCKVDSNHTECTLTDSQGNPSYGRSPTGSRIGEEELAWLREVELQDSLSSLSDEYGVQIQNLIPDPVDQKNFINLLAKNQQELNNLTKGENGEFKLPDDPLERDIILKKINKQKGMIDLLKSGMNGSYDAVKDNLSSLLNIAETYEEAVAVYNFAAENGVGALLSGMGDSLSAYWQEYQNGDAETKAYIQGQVLAEVGMLFIPGAGTAKLGLNVLKGAMNASKIGKTTSLMLNSFAKLGISSQEKLQDVIRISRGIIGNEIGGIGNVENVLTSLKSGRGLFSSSGKYVDASELAGSSMNNFKRFEKKLPTGAQNIEIKIRDNGNYVFRAEVPGNVKGSKALYEKEIDASGKTINYYKTTYDNNGNLVHVKDKVNGGIVDTGND